jgi:hypothetical protein
VNYTYLKHHGDFLKFIKRLDTDDMCADYTGALQKGAFSQYGELIEVLGGNTNKLMEDEDCNCEGECTCDERLEKISLLDYGPFAAEPKSYPAIVVWYFEESFDRCGDVSTSVLNFISLKELRTKGEIRSQPTPEEWIKEADERYANT